MYHSNKQSYLFCLLQLIPEVTSNNMSPFLCKDLELGNEPPYIS